MGGASLCSPIVGSGKAVGVPIEIEDSSGNPVTDLSGYTFELTDGVDTQDVTALISTPQNSQLVKGQDLTAYPVTLGAWGGAFSAYSTSSSSSGPTLDFSNPGYYFLDCTPDPASPKSTFGANVTLVLKSAGTTVATVSLDGRSATPIDEFSRIEANLPVVPAIAPSGASNTDFEALYRDYLALVGVPFRPAFAAFAIMELGNSSTGDSLTTVHCYDDLVTSSGGSWTWTAAGQAYIDELTASGASSWPILRARTTGAAGPSFGGTNPCNMALSDLEDDLFLNHLAAQLLLIDGPRGNVPASIYGSVSALQPAALLRLPVPPTTTTIPATTTTSPSSPTTTVPVSGEGSTTVARAADDEGPKLPSAGADNMNPLLAGFSLVWLGGNLLFVSRRRLTTL